jgi:hypothetical protein
MKRLILEIVVLSRREAEASVPDVSSDRFKVTEWRTPRYCCHSHRYDALPRFARTFL